MPQPDGPISEMNSPGWNSSSMFWSAVVPPLPNVFETFRIETAAALAHATFSGARRTTSRSDDRDDAEEEDPEQRRR